MTRKLTTRYRAGQKPKRVRNLGKKWSYDYLPSMLLPPGMMDKLDALGKWSGKHYSALVEHFIGREFQASQALTLAEVDAAIAGATESKGCVKTAPKGE